MGEREGHRSYIVFHVRGLPYACGLEEVKEIISTRELSPLPNARQDVMGLKNLRGEVVPIIDLERILFQPPYKENSKRVLVIQQGDLQIGLSVEGIHRIEEFDPEVYTLSSLEEPIPFIKTAYTREGSIPIPIIEMDLLANHIERIGVIPEGDHSWSEK